MQACNVRREKRRTVDDGMRKPDQSSIKRETQRQRVVVEDRAEHEAPSAKTCA